MIIILILGLLFSTEALPAQTLTDATLRQIAFDQKLGDRVDTELSFRDEAGKIVQLGDYFGRKPVILVLGYYECPMLCTLVLNGMIGGLQDIPLKMGRDYQVIDVSINPHETPALAVAKKQSYIKRFGDTGAADGWHFLTGDESAIRQLAGEVGFNYVYDPVSRQYAHPSGLVILSPKGTISHYLSGVVFSGEDLTEDLRDAGAAKVGSPIEQIFLLCFHYSPLTGKYSGLVMTVVRITAIAILTILIAFIADPRRRRRLATRTEG